MQVRRMSSLKRICKANEKLKFVNSKPKNNKYKFKFKNKYQSNEETFFRGMLLYIH